MCPIFSFHFLSLPQTSFSLQVTGVSCNMLCFPTWVLMRQMNIHEEEADIAVWQLCRGCLCARGQWWPCFWGICCAVGRHQETTGSRANDADVCVPKFCFGRWLWMTPCQGRSLSLFSSCCWGTARKHDTEKRSCCLHPPHTLLLAHDKTDAMGHLSGGYLGPFIIPLPLSCYLSSSFHSLWVLHFLSWNILCCDVWSCQHYVLKDIWESTWLILAAKGCMMRAYHASCVAISSCALNSPLSLHFLHCHLCSAL